MIDTHCAFYPPQAKFTTSPVVENINSTGTKNDDIAK